MASAEEDALSFIRDEAGAPNEKQTVEEVLKAFRWTHWLARAIAAAMALFVYVLVEHPTAPGFAFVVYLLARMPTKTAASAAIHSTMLLHSARSTELAVRRIQMQLARGGVAAADDEEDDEDDKVKVHRVPAAASSRPRAP